MYGKREDNIMNWVLSEHQVSKRRARRRGKSHGRQGLPGPEWKGGPVPYLQFLHALYTKKKQNLDQRLRIIEGQSVTFRQEDDANVSGQKYQITQLEAERSMYESQLAQLIEGKLGEERENPVGRAARHRHIPFYIYIVALIALGIGEFFVTLPAVKLLLNDEGLNATIITASFSALSILAAHLIGLTFKIGIDRDKPQPLGQRVGAIAIFVFINLVVLLLSALRSQSVSGVPVNFGLSDHVFGTVLFYFVQMTFILCAIALSYYNHSELESEMSLTKRRIKRTTRRIRNLTKASMTPSRGKMTDEKKLIQQQAIEAHKQTVESEYRELCAIYRQANLLAQKISFTDPGPGLTEEPLS